MGKTQLVLGLAEISSSRADQWRCMLPEPTATVDGASPLSRTVHHGQVHTNPGCSVVAGCPGTPLKAH